MFTVVNPEWKETVTHPDGHERRGYTHPGMPEGGMLHTRVCRKEECYTPREARVERYTPREARVERYTPGYAGR